MALKLQTIGPSVAELLKEVALNGGTHARAKESSTFILSECNKLQRVDVVGASLMKAVLYTLTGDSAESTYWLENARRNGGSAAQVVPYVELTHMLAGRASQGFELFETAFEYQPQDPAAFMRKALSFCWFKKAQLVAAKAPDGALDAELVSLANAGAAVLDVLKLPEQVIAAFMDVVHGLLFDEKLIWLDNLPRIQLLQHDQGGPLVFVRYRVATTPERAAELNWQLAERVAERELSSLGLLVTFQGAVLGQIAPTGEHAFA